MRSYRHAKLVSPSRPSVAVYVRSVSGESMDFSNYSPSGRCADIFAPGVNIFSTCRETRIYSTDDIPYCGIPELGQPEGGMHSASGYTFSNGTSMASPHVAGVAALLRSLYPEKSAAEIKA